VLCSIVVCPTSKHTTPSTPSILSYYYFLAIFDFAYSWHGSKVVEHVGWWFGTGLADVVDGFADI